jgi:hypothetical protein
MKINFCGRGHVWPSDRRGDAANATGVEGIGDAGERGDAAGST